MLSATKPVAITNARVAAGLNFSRSRIAMTIGVSSSAAPSLANRAEMAAPRMTTSGNSRRPRPPPQRATCRAAQWKKPASSSSSEMTIRATNVNVASQTMCQTTGMSGKPMEPVARATTAPPMADQPMPRPRGCQMTSARVAMKIAKASMNQCPIG